MMDRIKYLQILINQNKYSTYLEIGTQNGKSFLPIKCAKKIAVDPDFQIKMSVKYFWYIVNWANFKNKYFEMTSDDFFKLEKKFLKRTGNLDLIFIDGLHTFSATLKDILNSLKYLDRNGTIVIHDCFPPHKAASIKASNSDEAEVLGRKINGWTGEWCGDTWKAIAYMKRKFPNDLNISVLDFDYGIAKISFKVNGNINFEIDNNLYNEIDNFDYDDLIANPENLIGLEKFDENFI